MSMNYKFFTKLVMSKQKNDYLKSKVALSVNYSSNKNRMWPVFAEV